MPSRAPTYICGRTLKAQRKGVACENFPDGGFVWCTSNAEGALGGLAGVRNTHLLICEMNNSHINREGMTNPLVLFVQNWFAKLACFWNKVLLETYRWDPPWRWIKLSGMWRTLLQARPFLLQHAIMFHVEVRVSLKCFYTMLWIASISKRKHRDSMFPLESSSRGHRSIVSG